MSVQTRTESPRWPLAAAICCWAAALDLVLGVSVIMEITGSRSVETVLFFALCAAVLTSTAATKGRWRSCSQKQREGSKPQSEVVGPKIQAKDGGCKPAKALKVDTTQTNKCVAAGPTGITCVVQRCNKASLLVDNAENTVGIKRGLVVFVSFGEGVSRNTVQRMARQLVQLNLSTTGKWGDGSKAQSVADIVSTGARQEIMVIPQACLTSRVKGKQLRYTAQLSREDGFEMYCTFLAELEQALLEQLLALLFQSATARQCLCDKYSLDSSNVRLVYGRFDKRGVPIALEDQTELDKAERKALEKLFRCLSSQVHGHAVSAHKAWATCQQSQLGTLETDLVPKLFRVVGGTFGNRQGLRIDADCGPSTHVFTL